MDLLFRRRFLTYRILMATYYGTYSETYPAYGTGGGTTPTPGQPVAPDEAFDPTARVLTYTHALGSGELRYRRFGGPWQPYTPIQVDDNSHAANEWECQVKPSGSRPAGVIRSSRAIDPKVMGDVQIPANRSTKIPLSDMSYNGSKDSMQRIFDALKFTFSNGDIGISPGGENVYYNGGGPVGSDTEFARMWTRDAYYFFLAFLPFLPNGTTILYNWLVRLLAARSNNRIPDRIRADGTVERVPFQGVEQEPYDNNYFAILTGALYFEATGNIGFLNAYFPIFEQLYNAIPKQNGLTYAPPQAIGTALRVNIYGFYDGQGITGKSTFGAAQQYQCSSALAKMALGMNSPSKAQTWVNEGEAVKVAFNDPANDLWDESYGMFRCATIWGREVHDIPGNALAVECGLADNDKALRISQKINNNLSAFRRGGVPHGFLDTQALPGVSLWPVFVGPGAITFAVVDANGNRVPHPSGQGKDGSPYYSGADAATPAPYKEYQNLGLWYTFLCEILTTLALTNPSAAKQLLYDAYICANIDAANGQDNVESFNESGGWRCSQYAASAAGILRLMSGGGTDPDAVSPDPERIIQDNQSYINSAQARVQLWSQSSNWQPTGPNADFSAGEGTYIAGGLTDISRMQVRLMSPQKVEWISPKSAGLATMQYALTTPGGMPADSEWTEVVLNAPSAMPFTALAQTPVYQAGLYDLVVRVKPGQSATGIKDAFRFFS